MQEGKGIIIIIIRLKNIIFNDIRDKKLLVKSVRNKMLLSAWILFIIHFGFIFPFILFRFNCLSFF